MRVLITGAGGFVGRHLTALCAERGDEVTGAGRGEAPAGTEAAGWLTADLTDPAAALSVVRAARPERIYHLAAQSSVGASWRDPRRTIEENVAITSNLLDAVAAEAPGARVLVAGSAEQYGPPARLPMGEDEPFRPQNPYAVSKCASELVAGFYADAHGLHIVRTRSFNQVGPGTRGDDSVMSQFAQRIAAAELERRPSAVLHHADVRSTRDFTDVRDAARAYLAALEHARPDAYNVCSGIGRSVDDILTALTRLAAVPVERFRDPDLVRDNEVLEIRGSHDRLTEATGWQPRLPFERTLEDTLEFWRERLRQAVARS